MRRRLYLEFGYSSINQDAMQALGFSRSRCGHFIQLARKLDQLPVALAAEKEGAPRGAPATRPPVQIHVQEKADGRMTVPTEAGERELPRADAGRLHHQRA